MGQAMEKALLEGKRHEVGQPHREHADVRGDDPERSEVARSAST